jgi:SET domain-containing protein
MCWQHSDLRRGLKIKRSNINGAGDGLFATKFFDKGEIVCKYAGLDKRMTKTQYDATPGPHDYGFQHRNNYVFDGRSTQSGMGRWANDCRVRNRRQGTGECVENNVKAVVDTRNEGGHGMRLRATKPIHRGQEIHIPYHANFWANR